MKKAIITIIIIAIIVIAGFLIFSKNANAPTGSDDQDSQNPQYSGVQGKDWDRYKNTDLGIQFDYMSPVRGQTISPILANSTITLSPSDQFVRIFKKDPADSIETAVRELILKDYPKCEISELNMNPTSGFQETGSAYPDSYYSFTLVSQIYNPTDSDVDLGSLWQDQSCPEAYKQANGVRYFLADTKHPDVFVYFDIGQDAVLGPDGHSWQRTFRFID